MENKPEWRKLEEITNENRKPSFSPVERKSYETPSEKGEETLKRRLAHLERIKNEVKNQDENNNKEAA